MRLGLDILSMLAISGGVTVVAYVACVVLDFPSKLTRLTEVNIYEELPHKPSRGGAPEEYAKKVALRFPYDWDWKIDISDLRLPAYATSSTKYDRANDLDIIYFVSNSAAIGGIIKEQQAERIDQIVQTSLTPIDTFGGIAKGLFKDGSWPSLR